MHLQLNRSALTFQLTRIDGSSDPMIFLVEQTSNHGAKIHCLNCGEKAPTVEMTRLD
jgi:hypothetical protein